MDYLCSALCLSSSFVLPTFSLVTKCFQVENGEITQRRLANGDILQI